MTLTLQLTPEQVARLQAEADRSGLALADYVQRRLLGDSIQTAIDTAMGALAGSGISSDNVMSEKQAEVAHEETQWQDRFGPRSA